MQRKRFEVRIVMAMIVALSSSPASDAQSAQRKWVDDEIVSEATDGVLKATKGRYFEQACDESLEYDAQVIDLDGNGYPEVFTTVHGICLGGMTGSFLQLYVKDRRGRWKPQFGFPGVYRVLESRNKGYPDIEIGGPGDCSPVWRWNGQRYALHERCPVR
jgi:hypothetical protein